MTTAATPVPIVHVHPSILSFLEAITSFFNKAKPVIAAVEKVAGVAETFDPALAPEITAGEAVVTGIEGVAGELGAA